MGTPHSYFRSGPSFFTNFFATFLTAVFLAATFLATFFAGAFVAAFFAAFFGDAFLAAFFVTVFFPAFLTGAFLATFFAATFLSGGSFRTSVIVVTAAPNAVLMAPATSDAIAIPIPTVSPALSTIVLSAILRPFNLCVYMQSRIVEAYRVSG